MATLLGASEDSRTRQAAVSWGPPFWGSICHGSAYALYHDVSVDIFDEHVLSKLEIHVLRFSPGKNGAALVDCSPWHPALTFAPASLMEQVRCHVAATLYAAALNFSSDTLPFLDTFVRLCDLESARLELARLGMSHIADAPSSVVGRPRFLFTRKGSKATIGHELLSYGQKRLLSLLYYLETSPHHLVADEMANGLHHEWLKEIVQQLGHRQSFLSSQNPLLLDYMEFDSVDEVSRSFVLCERDELDRMVWRNMSAEEAASFYSAYAVGIQHPGEILRTKGVW